MLIPISLFALFFGILLWSLNATTFAGYLLSVGMILFLANLLIIKRRIWR